MTQAIILCMQERELGALIEKAVTKAFSAGIEDGRYVDISRVPLICQSVIQIGKDIKELKEVQTGLVTQDQFWPVKTLVYGLLALLLVGLVGFVGAQITSHTFNSPTTQG